MLRALIGLATLFLLISVSGAQTLPGLSGEVRRDGAHSTISPLATDGQPLPIRPATDMLPAVDNSQGPRSSVEPDHNTVLLNQLLTLLNDAVINKLEARVSLESVQAKAATVQLKGVELKDLRIGLLLNARGTEKLMDILASQAPPQGSRNSLQQMLSLLKIGLFNHLEIEIGLKSLKLQELSLNAEALKVEGLLLMAGAKPPDPETERPANDTWQILLQILGNNPLRRLTVHAGVDSLQAQRLNLQLSGAALEGLSVKVLLERRGNDPAPATTQG